MQRILRSRRRGRRRPWSRLLPFVVLILFVVAVFLLVSLWSNVFKERISADIDLTIVNGNAKYLPWKSDEWLNAYDGQKVLQGDSIKTSERGRAIFDVYNQYDVRLSNNTEVMVEELESKDGGYSIVLKVKNGEVWVSKRGGSADNSDKKIDLMVSTDNLLVTPLGTVFDVEKGSSELVRVMQGEVSVEVFSNEGRSKRSVDQFDLGVGQQVDIGERELAEFLSRLSPDVKEAIDSSWKTSEWFSWNTSVDASGQFNANPDSSDAVDTNGPTPPKVLLPDFEDRTTLDQSLTVSGTYTDDETTSIVIEAYIGDSRSFKEINPDKFSAGKWSFEISIDEGTMMEGNNRYEVFALDDAGNRSEPAIIEIYNGEKPNNDNEDDNSEQSTQGSIGAPSVTSYNGGSETSFDSDVTKIVVQGKAPKLAQKIIVDGYELQKFSPGDNTWTYNIIAGNNLVKGKNTYEVVAVDAEGNEASTTFTIQWEGPAEVVAPVVTPEVDNGSQVDETTVPDETTSNDESINNDPVDNSVETPVPQQEDVLSPIQ